MIKLKKAKVKVKVKENSNPELNNKLAATALSCYLNDKGQSTQMIAFSALAMYLKSHSRKNTAVVLAQAALALHLQDDPDSMMKSRKSFATIPPLGSAWGSKILMMRQLPTRR